MAQPDPNKMRCRVYKSGDQFGSPGSILIQPTQDGRLIGLRMGDDSDSLITWANLKPGAARRLAKRLLEVADAQQ